MLVAGFIAIIIDVGCWFYPLGEMGTKRGLVRTKSI
jgi:hypothetical protein